MMLRILFVHAMLIACCISSCSCGSASTCSASPGDTILPIYFNPPPSIDINSDAASAVCPAAKVVLADYIMYEKFVTCETELDLSGRRRRRLLEQNIKYVYVLKAVFEDEANATAARNYINNDYMGFKKALDGAIEGVLGPPRDFGPHGGWGPPTVYNLEKYTLPDSPTRPYSSSSTSFIAPITIAFAMMVAMLW